MSDQLTRRRFLAAGTAAGLALGTGRPAFAAEKPAILGGKPVRTQRFASWPKSDTLEDKAVLEVLRSGKWYRGNGRKVGQFEEAFARLTGAKGCLATANGTSALVTSLGALEIGPGDEVIVPPYTFIATVNAVLLHYALPIFVDSDRETFQIDARKVEASVTDRTAAILPVHLGGAAADMDTILAVAAKRRLPVIEDACQSHLAEWRGRKVGTLGTTGCFSFQASKNLTSGEGGAILTNDEELLAKCYAFHNNNGAASRKTGYSSSYRGGRAANLRMPEFQGALLLAQMTRLEAQSRTREQNAQYLTAMLREIPGIAPAQMYEGCTRNAYHLFMFRYDPRPFADLPRQKFLAALAREGIPASRGYSPLNKEAFLKDVFQTKGYRKIYGEKELARWEERTRCPENERLCAEAVWFTQNVLLGERSDMDQIAEAVRKIHAHAAALAKA